MSVTKVTTDLITSLDAAKLTGTLPAISGANLTSLPSDITKQSSAPTVSSPATPTVGDLILATSTGQMYVCSVVSSGANQWINIGDGSGSVVPIISATGGTIVTYTYDSVDYKVHKFTATGLTNLVVASVPSGRTIDVLVIAGGGGGSPGVSGANNGGGGGAGGLRWFTGQTPTASTYAATVGAGGAGGNAATATSGTDSTFIGTGISITANGGGNGGYAFNTAPVAAGAGGSGGGSSGTATAGAGNQGAFTPVEGFIGGTSSSGSSGGGGGGSGSLGLDGDGSNGGHAGAGEDNFLNQSSAALTIAGTKALLDAVSLGEVSGSSRHIAGGGGGGGAGVANGGLGGGGDGLSSAGGEAGTVNTGSGGGGANHATANNSAASGGSGVILVRYLA